MISARTVVFFGALACALLVVPGLAEACPMCASGESRADGSTLLLAVFIIAPIVIGAAAVVYITALARRSRVAAGSTSQPRQKRNGLESR